MILTNIEIPPSQKIRLEGAPWSYEVVSLSEARLRKINFEDVDVMIMGGEPGLRPSERAKNLRLFQTLSAGVDHFDLSSIPDGAVICSNVGAYAEPIAETVFAFVLAFAKDLPSLQTELQGGGFPRWDKRGIFLKGKTMGVIGAGGIGRATARLAKAFGMKVFGIASRPRSIENFDFVGSLNDLDYLMRESDVVVISIPLTLRTKGLINRQRLNQMKQNAILVNVARGPVIVEKDLYDHLRKNPDFRAGIDVWWKYPKKGEKFEPDYPFAALKNVLMTPHSSAMVPEIDVLGVARAVDNVIDFLRGQEPRGVVNRSDYVPG